MGKVAVSVEVEENSYKVGQAVKNIVQVCKQQLDDGFQADQDLPKILTESLTSLLVVLGNFSQIPDEAKDDIEAFMSAWGLAGVQIAGLFLKKK